MAPFRALVQARLDGYEGGKSAIYGLIAELRPHAAQLTMRFEGLPGEFSQHDFAEVRITYVDGSCEVAWFFCSRLKCSRWAVVGVVPNKVAVADHFVAFGGVPLCAVLDRPKTVTLKWAKNGELTDWNPILAYTALELGFTDDVRSSSSAGSMIARIC